LAVFASRAIQATSTGTVAATKITSSEGWLCFSAEYQPILDTLVQPQFTLARPAQGTAKLFVDDVSLVEWQSPLDGTTSLVTAPNEFEYARCRTQQSGTSVSLHWVTGRYLPN
jgi:hypothetical protein